MIIVRLFGGLGNQMFQYAAGRRLALQHHVPLALDTSLLQPASAPKQETRRSYRLACFNLSAEVLPTSEADAFHARLSQRRFRLLSRVSGRLRGYHLMRERSSRFDDRILSAPDNSYLLGYWQSDRYFQDVGGRIRDEFTLTAAWSEEDRRVAALITRTPSVAVHVRRGDYVTNERYNRVHGLCSVSYYQQALERLTREVGPFHVFLFSDDPTWTEANLRTSLPATQVRHNGPDRDFADMTLMALCNHQIIANSSFSWWAAWLCGRAGNRVIAPRNWFAARGHRDTTALCPPHWAVL